ncbi:MAG: electron transporter RnfB, partial [Deltaproteobacteria bacterium]
MIRTRRPLVGTIGRICPHPCEDRCFRGIDGEPISINGCKRYLADMRAMRLEKGYEPPSPPPALDDGPKVAIIGAGPAGL